MHGIRSACHLLVYGCGTDPLVCIVGNFDGGLGSPTTNGIEVVATAVAARVGRKAFRLLEWHPHDAARRFSEVTLNVVADEKIARGEVIVSGGMNADIVRRDTAVVRFVDPRWRQRSEDEVAELLGEDSVRELRSYAGLPGDYVPERLFGATGKELADTIRAHNRAAAGGLEAQIQEWTDS